MYIHVHIRVYVHSTYIILEDILTAVLQILYECEIYF